MAAMEYSHSLLLLGTWLASHLGGAVDGGGGSLGAGAASLGTRAALFALCIGSGRCQQAVVDAGHGGGGIVGGVDRGGLDDLGGRGGRGGELGGVGRLGLVLVGEFGQGLGRQAQLDDLGLGRGHGADSEVFGRCK